MEKTSECWLWRGAINQLRGGYGAFWDDRQDGGQQLRRAHRVAYELATGTALNDPTVVVRHTCDTPACVRPDHLLLGTQADNLDDMHDRGRGIGPNITRGVARYNARLTDDVVRQLRQRHASGETYTSLAAELGVSRFCVTAAIKGRNWAHIA